MGFFFFLGIRNPKIGKAGLLAVVAAALAAAACTGADTSSSAPPQKTPPPYACNVNSAGGRCSGGLVEFDCSGGDTVEDSRYACGTPIRGANGESIYCCKYTPPPPDCVADAPDASTCGYYETAYDCMNGATPSGLACEPNGSQLCCVPTPAGCTLQPQLTGCYGDAFPFACPGAQAPGDASSSLDCSMYYSPLSAGSGIWCCTSKPAPPPPTCAQTSSGCPAGATSYSCTGGATPAQGAATGQLCDPGQAQADGSTLYCCTSGSCFAEPAAQNSCPGGTTVLCGSSQAPAGNGSTLSCTSQGSPEGGAGFTRYCCKDVSCASDPTVTGCIPGTSGYSCMSPATPDIAQAGLVCPQNGGGGSGTTYCCNTLGTACEPDLTVPCGSGKFGYSCNGLYTPSYGGGWSLPCTQGTASSSKTEYCCDLPATCETYTSDLCGSSISVTGWLCTGTSVPGMGTCGPSTALGSHLTGYCCN